MGSTVEVGDVADVHSPRPSFKGESRVTTDLDAQKIVRVAHIRQEPTQGYPRYRAFFNDLWQILTRSTSPRRWQKPC